MVAAPDSSQALRQTASGADVALIGWAILVGASLVAGALVAVVLRLPERIAAVLTSFGGGLLVAAIAFELVPEADERAGTVVTVLGLLAGTLVYVGADAWLTRDEAMAEMRRSGQAAAAGQPMTMSVDHAEAARGESIAVGLFVDGVPESIALGLTVAEGEIGLALLVGIVVGNVVEAYGAALCGAKEMYSFSLHLRTRSVGHQGSRSVRSATKRTGGAVV